MLSVKIHGEARFGEAREKFTKAIQCVNDMVVNEEIWLNVNLKYGSAKFVEGFNLSYSKDGKKISLKEIRGFFEASQAELLVNTYVPKFCMSRAIAYTLPDSNVMYFNKNKFGHKIMTHEFLANIIIHESVHIVDFSLEEYEFGHGSNSGQHKPEKKRSAPIWMGENFHEPHRGNGIIKRGWIDRMCTTDYCVRKKA